MYQSIPSLTIPPPPPPGDPWGFAHFSCPMGRVFAPLFCRGVCPWVCPGVLYQSNFEKSAIFALSPKQHMFIYDRSEQHDLVPICTITNTQCIRIYPGKLKFMLVKASSAPGQRKPNHIHVSYY